TWRSRLTARTSWRVKSSASRLQQIPFSAPGIGKDRNKPIGLAARRFQEGDAALTQLLVIRPEVPGVKEEADPSSRLIADAAPLTLVARNSEHQRGASARRRSDHHPSLDGREGGVFKNLEAEGVAEKGEPILIAGHKDRYGREALEHGLSAHMVEPLGDID